MMEHPYRIAAGQQVRLADQDPGDSSLVVGKAAGKDELNMLTRRLADLERVLHAEAQQKILIILQGMDTGGKDGTIRHVFKRVNPKGVNVASFRVPTEVELSHDYLWRIHRHTPGRGEIAIFNRSHYEDVLIVRVHELVPEAVWSRRYGHINDFERMLADEGATILKFFLHISKDEQKERLERRRDKPHKRWKLSRADVEERKLWDRYREANEIMLSRTSTERAPWFLIPANRKWYRNLIVSRILVGTLEGLDMDFPEAEEGIDDLEID